MLTRKIKLWDINAHITCRLCSGYLIDATTVTECLHTFCRSCLVKYLEENNTCPTCRIVIHQSHPLQYIGHDRTMQDIVYKLVPGLQEAEMRKQREFYHKLGLEVPGDIKGETCSAKQHLDSHRNGETKADDSSNKEAAEEKQEEDGDYHRSDEQVSICLECNSSKLRGLKRKWIRCSAQATVLHLKKFIAKKLNLSSFNEGGGAPAYMEWRRHWCLYPICWFREWRGGCPGRPQAAVSQQTHGPLCASAGCVCTAASRRMLAAKEACCAFRLEWEDS
ncbi:polycomb group RING finger protein 3 isoform X2 [Orcinus orca]|uniref:polycomb group RING finger protein 3 isoform X2 n=1 Tax=Orcinus orca TaxID=9733 RepID=UPI001441B545|nr:polycomb group RING finger protein 3 isoform X2 [Orcinus orca]XP_049565159.1 polycomb group RING finger protein 3 isoform X2 [Orcinus orca]XP_049565160.1 polycomb group RING finger protein 3 isoform X2 [Orcinus orca]